MLLTPSQNQAFLETKKIVMDAVELSKTEQVVLIDYDLESGFKLKIIAEKLCKILKIDPINLIDPPDSLDSLYNLKVKNLFFAALPNKITLDKLKDLEFKIYSYD